MKPAAYRDRYSGTLRDFLEWMGLKLLQGVFLLVALFAMTYMFGMAPIPH